MAKRISCAIVVVVCFTVLGCSVLKKAATPGTTENTVALLLVQTGANAACASQLPGMQPELKTLIQGLLARWEQGQKADVKATLVMMGTSQLKYAGTLLWPFINAGLDAIPSCEDDPQGSECKTDWNAALDDGIGAALRGCTLGLMSPSW